MIVLVAAIVATAAACGGGATTSTGDGLEATEDGLKAAAKGGTEAALAGESEAMYEGLSAECRSKWGVADWAANMKAGLLLAEGFANVSVSDAQVGEVHVRNVTATSGEAVVDLLTADGNPLFGDSSDTNYVKWVYEDDAWRTTSCDKLGEVSSSGSTDGTAEVEVEAEDYLDLEVSESALTVIPGSSDATSTYAVVVKNPNPDAIATNVSVNLTMLDAQGGVVKSEDTSISVILPNETGAAANGVDAPGAVKMTVQLTVDRWEDPPADVGALTVANTTRRDAQYGGTEMSGNLISTWTQPVSAQVFSLLRDEAGTLVGGTFTYVSDVPAVGQKSFSISTMNTIPTTWQPEYLAVLSSVPG